MNFVLNFKCPTSSLTNKILEMLKRRWLRWWRLEQATVNLILLTDVGKLVPNICHMVAISEPIQRQPSGEPLANLSRSGASSAVRLDAAARKLPQVGQQTRGRPLPHQKLHSGVFRTAPLHHQHLIRRRTRRRLLAFARIIAHAEPVQDEKSPNETI